MHRRKYCFFIIWNDPLGNRTHSMPAAGEAMPKQSVNQPALKATINLSTHSPSTRHRLFPICAAENICRKRESWSLVNVSAYRKPVFFIGFINDSCISHCLTLSNHSSELLIDEKFRLGYDLHYLLSNTIKIASRLSTYSTVQHKITLAAAIEKSLKRCELLLNNYGLSCWNVSK